MDGMSFAFDVYKHELLIANDTPGIFYTWAVRTSWPEIWVPDTNRGGVASSVYYGGPNYVRSVNIVDDLVIPMPRTARSPSGSTNWAGSSATATAPTARRRRTSTTCA
jgi:hypothetical protein